VPSGACKSAAGRAQSPSGKGIVAACIEQDDVQLGAGALHLAQHHRGVDHLQIDVGFLGRIGINRHQEIASRDLDTMASVIEQGDVGAQHRIAEFLQHAVERLLVEVELRPIADQREAKSSQRIGHQLRVVAGIGERRDVLIGGVSNHQRDTLLSARRLRQATKDDD
jgi:hypothetical protein